MMSTVNFSFYWWSHDLGHTLVAVLGTAFGGNREYNAPLNWVFFASDFNCVCSFLDMTQYQRRVQNRWLNIEEGHSWLGVVLQVQLRSHGSFLLHPKSPLTHEHPSRETSPNPWVIQTCLRHQLTFLRAKCGLRLLLPKWSRCSGYPNHTWVHQQ